jgi:hypothetical protein
MLRPLVLCSTVTVNVCFVYLYIVRREGEAFNVLIAKGADRSRSYFTLAAPHIPETYVCVLKIVQAHSFSTHTHTRVLTF